MIIKKGKSISLEEFEAIEKLENDLINPISIEKVDKWYLPRLNLNDTTMWESKPLEKRKHFTDQTAFETCIGNCCGIKGLKSACCTLDPENLEHVLGPCKEEWIEETIKWMQKSGLSVRRSDIVIDYEEGKLIGETFFNDHEVFKSKTSYPMLRIQVSGRRFICKWLNNDNGKCTIYTKRPEFCKNYLCQYVKTNFLIRTPDKPNTWTKVR